MADIVEFKPRANIVKEGIVEALETYLALAKEGKLIGLSLAGVLDTGDMYTCTCESTVFPALLGAMSFAQFRAMRGGIVMDEEIS